MTDERHHPDWVSGYLDEELSPAERAAAEEELSAPSLRGETLRHHLEGLRALQADLGRLARPGLNRDLTDAIWSTIDRGASWAESRLDENASAPTTERKSSGWLSPIWSGLALVATAAALAGLLLAAPAPEFSVGFRPPMPQKPQSQADQPSFGENPVEEGEGRFPQEASGEDRDTAEVNGSPAVEIAAAEDGADDIGVAAPDPALGIEAFAEAPGMPPRPPATAVAGEKEEHLQDDPRPTLVVELAVRDLAVAKRQLAAWAQSGMPPESTGNRMQAGFAGSDLKDVRRGSAANLDLAESSENNGRKREWSQREIVTATATLDETLAFITALAQTPDEFGGVAVTAAKELAVAAPRKGLAVDKPEADRKRELRLAPHTSGARPLDDAALDAFHSRETLRQLQQRLRKDQTSPTRWQVIFILRAETIVADAMPVDAPPASAAEAPE